MTDIPGRGSNTVCFPEMRRGNVGLCVATQFARHTPFFGRLSGFASPEQAWAETQAQLAWYREMQACGEMAQICDCSQLDAHLQRWQGAQAGQEPKLPIGYILSLEG
ncbi:MAG: hypothetical protein RIQ93_2803, partial [Verrucomicrobiota bacterium]